MAERTSQEYIVHLHMYIHRHICIYTAAQQPHRESSIQHKNRWPEHFSVCQHSSAEFYIASFPGLPFPPRRPGNEVKFYTAYVNSSHSHPRQQVLGVYSPDRGVQTSSVSTPEGGGSLGTRLGNRHAVYFNTQTCLFTANGVSIT